MPSVKNLPPTLAPYAFHGLTLHPQSHLGEAIGDCPFCGREQKFYVSLDTGKFRCQRCQVGSQEGGGNAYTFLNQIWEYSRGETSERDYQSLAEERGIDAVFLAQSELVRNPLTGDWVVPGRSVEGTLTQLYRYVYNRDAEKNIFLPTPGLDGQSDDPSAVSDGKRHGILGMEHYDPDLPVLYLCEGLWDMLILREVLSSFRRGGDDLLIYTDDPVRSLAREANILAVPGCTIFLPSWAQLFEGKKVYLLFDNDHPLRHPRKKTLSEPMSHMGMRKVCERILAAPTPPESISYLRWAPEPPTATRTCPLNEWSDCYNPSLPHGYDLRDVFSSGTEVSERVKALKGLIQRFRPIPSEWADTAKVHKEGVDVVCKPCGDYRTLQNAWLKALKWTYGLDMALSVSLACILSTETIGEQLWAVIMGPPSTGKSTICEALALAERYVHSSSTIKEVYSGYKTDKDGGEDFSVVARIRNKTFIVKDGDTILKNPARATILSQYRDLFDGVGRSQFNNGTSRCYKNTRFTFLIWGTAAMYEMDTADLGARFFHVSIMDGIDRDFERSVNLRVAHRTLRNVRILVNGKPESRQDSALVEARALTGGYVNYLRRNAERILNTVSDPDEATVEKVVRLAEFVARMRAKPPKNQSEKVEREFSPRLVEQFMRLSVCLAAVLGEPTVNDKVLSRVRKVALDTAYGQTLDICKHLYKHQDKGVEVGAIENLLHIKEEKALNLLVFLKRIAVADWTRKSLGSSIRSNPRWRLTEEFLDLYEAVLGEEG